MRHAKKFNHLSRKKGHRRALLANLGCALIEHKRITTTVAKAKALRMYLEPLITKAKNNTTHNRRQVFAKLQSKDAIKELFDVIGAKIADRPGGYLRIIKLGFRQGDGAEMAMIEFVDFNEVYEGSKTATGKKTRRSGGKKRSRRGGKKKETTKVEETVEESAEVIEESTEKEATEEPKNETPDTESTEENKEEKE